MRSYHKWLFISLILAFLTANADEASEKIYLTQIVNQLNAIQPLILAAQKEQPTNQRIQFHYSRYKDSRGQVHNGLLEDVQAIKKGIEAQLNSTTVEPRTFQPIQGDYLDQAKPSA